ncbi:MAG: glutamine--fructose-6-phosphate transaminase (isomerizing), partial [Nitrososphaerota archaeon]|nr:glutamine--fructose-6-phosphate transaminase (isomerizing) [Nitrososphaerota archaeon]
MCGIIGILGRGDVAPYLVDGLGRLEYRGYDSAGMAVMEDGAIAVLRTVGTVERLAAMYRGSPVSGAAGLAHTRWATHGGVSDRNAHPHVSCGGEAAVIHNGIIENHAELREELSSKGHAFKSETDTEVAVHLLEEALAAGKGPLEAGMDVARRLRGQYALVFLMRGHPDVILAMRKNAPLLVGLGKGESIVASDALAFIDRTNRVVFLEDDTLALVARDGVRVYGFLGQERPVVVTDLAQELTLPDKHDHEHFTIKEIREQPEAVERVVSQVPGSMTIFRRELEKAKRVFFVAAGTSYHAALLAKRYFSDHMKLYGEVILASEYRGSEQWFDDGAVVVCISQSGETMDVLEAARSAKGRGATVLSMVNRSPSSLEMLSDAVVKLNVGPEVGVAATKSFTAQVVLFYALARGGASEEEVAELKGAMEAALAQEQEIIGVAELVAKGRDVYFLGRGVSYPMALEGALKMKELAYLHAEGLAAGELKHGPLALVDSGTPLVLLNPED